MTTTKTPKPERPRIIGSMDATIAAKQSNGSRESWEDGPPLHFDDNAPPTETSKTEPPAPVGYSFARACNAPLSSPYIVKGIVAPGSVTIFFGDSGALKSFVATDLAGHVAASLDWHGRRVNGGGVLVVLGEGQGGYAKRLRAWAQAKAVAPESVKLYVYPRPVDLNAGPSALEVAIAEAEAALGCKVILDVVDTYSTNLGDADEQSNSDAARVLGNGRIAAGPSRATAFIHHVGHSDGDRERGAYQLRANAEFRFVIKRDGNTITMTNKRAKDEQEIAPMQFTFRTVDLGIDSDGDPITSLVIDAAHGLPVPTAKAPARKRLRPNQKLALDAVEVSINLHGRHPGVKSMYFLGKGVTIFEARAEFDRIAAHIESRHRSTRFSEAISGLKATGVIDGLDEWLWVKP